MKKIVLVVGARPNYMKAFPVYNALRADFDVTLIHTGQHFDEKMNAVFFHQMGIPEPDFHFSLQAKSKAGDWDKKLYQDNRHLFEHKGSIIQELLHAPAESLGQLGEIRSKLCEVLRPLEPDLVIVFGDVTSTLAAALAAKMLEIPLAHVEAGLRSGDFRMPEEVNRILTDHISTFLFVTEPSGLENLEREGKDRQQLFAVGNTMIDTQKKMLAQALATRYHETIGLTAGSYVLVTLHRPGNVDEPQQLRRIFDDLLALSQRFPILYPIHPRTQAKLLEIGYLDQINQSENFILSEALGYLEFSCLLANCRFLITDSGGLQEESTALKIPCFTLRTNTERPSTLIENGGTNQLIDEIGHIVLKPFQQDQERWDGNASQRIMEILRQKLSPINGEY